MPGIDHASTALVRVFAVQLEVVVAAEIPFRPVVVVVAADTAELPIVLAVGAVVLGTGVASLAAHSSKTR